MAPDLQLNIYSFYKLGTCRLWIQLSGDPKSGSAWRVPGWIPEDHAHRRMEHHMCFFWTSSPAAHVCAHVLWGLSFPKYLVQVHSAVLPQRKPSPRSMDFAGLTKQPPRKDFSSAGWVMHGGCPCSSSASVLYLPASSGPQLAVLWADAALRGRKIPRRDAFSSIGTSSWCLALLQWLTTATDIWEVLAGSDQYLLKAIGLKSAWTFPQVRKGKQTFGNEPPTDPSLDKASEREREFKSDLEDLASSQATSSLFVANSVKNRIRFRRLRSALQKKKKNPDNWRVSLTDTFLFLLSKGKKN